MLFNSLDRLKRMMVLLIVFLMFTGLTMFVVPTSFFPLMGQLLGFIFLVFAFTSILDFIDSNKALIHYIRLFVGLVLGMTGVLLFSIEGLFLPLLNGLAGTLPILLGGYGLYHALAFARRSGRKRWWIMVILSSLLLVFGTVLFCNPWKGDLRKTLYVIGGTLFYSAVVYAIDLFWIWPFKETDGGDVK